MKVKLEIFSIDSPMREPIIFYCGDGIFTRRHESKGRKLWCGVYDFRGVVRGSLLTTLEN
jgi:hypothetical protein